MSDTTSPPPGSAGAFLNALTDPRVDALIGAAQGFAQGAMPSRLPVPFGAVLGMGGAGALAGAQQGQQMRQGAQQLQLGQQQLQAAQIQNQRSQMLMNAYNQMYGGSGAPFGAPGAGQGGSGNVLASQTGGGQSPNYLTSPQQLKMLGDLAMATGQDRSAATLYGMPTTMAGGAGYAMGADGTAFAVPGGSADPGAQARLAYQKEAATKAAGAPYAPPISLDVPDGQGGTITKQIPATKWAATNGGPPAPIQPGLVPPDPFPGYAKKINTNESGNDPNATNSASTAAGPGQFLNNTWPSVIRATRPDLAAGQSDAQLMALRNDPALAASATEQYARMNGAALAQRGQPVNGTTIALAHGFGPGGASTILAANPNAPLAMLPNMAGPIAANPQLKNMTAGQLIQQYQSKMGESGYGGKVTLGPQAQAALDVQTANAKAMGAAAADRTKLITTRAGVFDPVTNQEIYRQPEYHELQDPNTGQEYPAFVQPGANGQLSVQGGPPGMANGALPPSKLGPGQEDTIKHLADQYSNEDKQKYEGATNALFQLDQQDKNMAALNAGGGWSATGAGANAKMEWAKAINSGFQSLGIAPPMDPTKVASWEDASKLQTQLAFAQAKQLGSHEAASVVSQSRLATPGAENTPQGYQAITSGYHEMNNREVDSYNFKTGWLQAHGGNLTGAETAFNNQFTPKMYADRAVSTVEPVKITATDQPTAMAQMSKYLPGTIVTLPNGKQSIVPPRPNAPQIPSYIQGYIQPPAGAPSAP